MIKVLLVSQDKNSFFDMIDAFKSRNVQVYLAQSGTLALTMIEKTLYNLLITDEHLPDMTGRFLIEKTVTLNPLMNCVAISTLSYEDFHEEFEGMGVLMQFPPSPDAQDVQKLLDHLEKIYSLSKQL